MRYKLVSAFAISAMLLSASATSAADRPGRTERISVSPAGAELHSPEGIVGWVPAVSRDGRYVAFESFSAGYAPVQEAWISIVVADRATGDLRHLDAEGDGFAYPMSFSADGRFLVFSSFSPRNVPDDRNGYSDIFLYDLHTDEIELISKGIGGYQTDEDNIWPNISADGRYVVYSSRASNLVVDDTKLPGQRYDLYVYDRVSGVTERVSKNNAREEIDGNPLAASISANGRFIAFSSNARNLVLGDTNLTSDVFVHDRVRDVTERVSVASDGTEGNGGSGISHGPSISDDGRFVAFDSQASNLVPHDTNTASDVFVHDRLLGTTERVSVSSYGEQADPRRLPTQTSGSYLPLPGSMSPDGRYIVFASDAGNLGTVGANTPFSLFLHDRHTGRTEAMSLSSEGVPGNGTTDDGVVNADGSLVVFESVATNLVADDTNTDSDIFTRERGAAVDVLDLVPVIEGDTVHLGGTVTFAGGVLSEGFDLRRDAVGPNVGQDLIAARLSHRPDEGELVAWIEADSMPTIDSPRPTGCPFGTCQPSMGGAPGVLHQLNLRIDEVRYELRAMGVSGAPVTQRFEAYRCDPDCVQVSVGRGDIAGTGSRSMMVFPLDALNASQGAEISRVRATSTVGITPVGTVLAVDEAVLSDVVLHSPRVDIAVAPQGSEVQDLVFTGADFSANRFQGSVDVSSLTGPLEAWARACLGSECSVERVAL